MEIKLGATGLTQKEAIFRIFKRVLGSKFDLAIPVRNVLETKPNNYGSSKWESSQFNRIIHEIYEGLCSGVIPSKLNSDRNTHGSHYLDQLRRNYANRIAHYWMKHDKRLNGNKSGTRTSSPVGKYKKLAEILAQDKAYQALTELYSQHSKSVESFEIQTYILSRAFQLTMETFGIKLSSLPAEIQKHLKQIDSVTESPSKKAA